MSAGSIKSSGRILAALAVAMVVVAVGAASGGEFSERTVGYNEIVEVRSEEPCLWDARDPLTLRLIQYEVIDHETEGDTDFIALFQSGSKARTIVIDAWRNGAVIPDKDRFVIKVGDEDEEEEEEEEVTQYGVGPATAKAFEGTSKDLVANIFELAAVNVITTDNVSLEIASIRKQIDTINTNERYSEPYNRYVVIMSEAFADKRVRTVEEHAGAYQEIAEWLRK